MLVVLLLGAWSNALANPVKRDHIEVALVAANASVGVGTPITLGLRFLPDEHWHTYWLNPGDSGIALDVEWSLPDGASVSEVHWPYPQRIEVGHLVNYGYEGEHLLPMVFTPPADAQLGDLLEISVAAYWLVCRVECIPGEATLSLTLPVTETMGPSVVSQAALFEWARNRQPIDQPQSGQFSTASKQLSIRLPKTGVLQTWTPDPKALFVSSPNVVDHAKEVFVAVGEESIQLAQPISPFFSGSLDGLSIVAVDEDQQKAYRWTLTPDAFISDGDGVASQPYWWVLVLALLGGLLLNLMPCVFPVLSLKALQVVQTPRSHQRSHAVWYALGVVSSFVALAVLLLGLRAGGAAIGWGFQLQSPVLVAGLIYLFFLMGLSLSGYVDLANRWMGMGEGLTQGSGVGASFMTGVLATVVASPCTAPFMGVALGAAIVMPWGLGLGVFAMLGFGLALPMLAFGFLPVLAKALPSPGTWMTTFKELMAFPIYLAVVWLIWVLARQTNPTAVAYILIGLVALSLMIWISQLPERYRALQGIRHSLLAFCLITALAMLASAARAPASDQTESGFWVSYSQEQLDALIADPKTAVLVNMTADWCVTCLVNEQVALNTPEFKEALSAHNVVYMKGDWTRRDPAITAYLSQFGRNGVPLYVAYPRDGSKPIVLPQVLTPDTVVDVLKDL